LKNSSNYLNVARKTTRILAYRYFIIFLVFKNSRSSGKVAQLAIPYDSWSNGGQYRIFAHFCVSRYLFRQGMVTPTIL